MPTLAELLDPTPNERDHDDWGIAATRATIARQTVEAVIQFIENYGTALTGSCEVSDTKRHLLKLLRAKLTAHGNAEVTHDER